MKISKHGIIEKEGDEPKPTKNEEEIFKKINIKWIDPSIRWRN